MPALTAKIDDGIDGLRIGRMHRYFLDGSDPEVADYTDAVIADLGHLAASLPISTAPILNTAARSPPFFQRLNLLASMKRRSSITTGR